MQYYMPAKIFAENDCVKNHSADLAALGTRPLIVTGRSSARKNGSFDDVTAALSAQGQSWTLFDQIEENPSVETVMAARNLGLAEGCDYVIGIGGGSPMDAAKAAAFMMKNSGRDWDALYDTSLPDDMLPVCCVPTTCGTGSEATAVAVMTRHDKKTKQSASHKLFARLSLVDGKYLACMPFHTLCDTAVDALAHMWESWLNTRATDFSRLFVREGLRAWQKNLPVLRKEKQPDAQDYANLMYASTLGGMSIAHTGTSIPHALSYDVTYELGMKHGKAVGRFQAGYLTFAEESEREQLLTMAGFRTLEEFEDLFTEICGKEPLPEALVQRTVHDVINNPGKVSLCPYPLDEEKLTKIVLYPNI